MYNTLKEILHWVLIWKWKEKIGGNVMKKDIQGQRNNIGWRPTSKEEALTDGLEIILSKEQGPCLSSPLLFPVALPGT